MSFFGWNKDAEESAKSIEESDQKFLDYLMDGDHTLYYYGANAAMTVIVVSLCDN